MGNRNSNQQSKLTDLPGSSTDPPESKLASPPVLDDDEPLPYRANLSQISTEHLKISLYSSRNFVCPSDLYQEFPCALIIEAPQDITNSRPGVDIILVIDTGDTMKGDKLENVKKTLEFIIAEVSEIDRITIVSYGDNAKKLLPLTVMNETGKEKLTNAISQLVASGQKNMVEALDLGIQLVINRTVKTSPAAILMLSDGFDKDPLTVCERAKSCIDSYNASENSYTIHSFGYGHSHDSKFLSLIAELRQGGYYSITDIESIPQAFANCLGELFSAIADKVEIVLSPLPSEINFKLTKIYSSTGDFKYSMPNILHGQSQEAVFLMGLQLKESQIHGEFEVVPVRARVSYRLIRSNEEQVVEKELVIKVKEGEDGPGVNVGIVNCFWRVNAAEALASAGLYADVGDLEKGMIYLKRCVNELRGAGVENTDLGKILIKDLQSARLRLRDYGDYENGGRAEIKYKYMKHFYKRGEDIELYQNECQRNMHISCKTHFCQFY